MRFQVLLAFATLIGCSGGSGVPPSPNIAGSDSMASAGGGTAGAAGMTTGGQPVTGGGGGFTSTSAGAAAAGRAGASAAGSGVGGQATRAYPPAADVIEVLARVNAQFASKWPDPGAPIVVGGTSRPSNIWTRAVYYEGLLALHGINPKRSI